MADFTGILGMDEDPLIQMGKRLRLLRKRRGDRQADAAARCGVSLETYRKMEAGHPGVGIGHWVRAISIYGDPGALSDVLPVSLFDQLDGQGEAR